LNNQIHIGFEGPIGAGKTTLAQLLAARVRSQPILEDVDGNEFLADFYKDRGRWSLAMQLWFLTTRHEQWSHAVSSDAEWVIADYTYAKDGVFARLLLNERELRLYERIASALALKVPRPNLIVYLDASDDVLVKRIKQRNRTYESSITSTYLNSVREAYEHYFFSKSGLKILRYNTSKLNLESESQMQRLYQSILSLVS
jgi:deoxyadenosine/deoxycytidine kinase